MTLKTMQKALDEGGANACLVRRQSGESQSAFWRRFGVSASAGARYEAGRRMPAPLALLLALWVARRVRDDDLDAARRASGVCDSPMRCREPWGPTAGRNSAGALRGDARAG